MTTNREAELREALEPCPFCGGDAEFSDSRPKRRANVRCQDCGVTTIADRKEEAALHWNTRAALATKEPTGGVPSPAGNKLQAVFEAAYGLCMGYDWNNGTAARDCGYRRKLLSAVNAIREVPDFEDKYRNGAKP